MSYAVLFPGQGSQFVGMGEDVFEAHPDLLGDRSDEILGWSLRDLCLNGPEEDLTRTEKAQPALFALSYALWLSAREAFEAGPDGAAGHSLGEYTALVAGGSIGFDEGLELVALRGRLMAEAADREPSGMAALLGADLEVASAVVEARQAQGGRLEIANINAPGQVVVAGGKKDIDWLAESGRDHGVRRAVPLKVAGAFHSSYMQPAADELAEKLDSVAFSEPTFPIWANVTASPHESHEIASSLHDQVTSTVRFHESLQAMERSGIDTFVHIGPGDVTAGLAKRSLPDATVHTVSSIEGLQSVADALSTMDRT